MGGEVEYWVEYGPTKAYGSASEHRTVSAQQNVPAAVTVGVSGLQRSSSYHYRFCARDAQQQGGPGCGEDRRFKTQSFACGETVTSDVRLTASMECPDADPGLIVGASGIDINLAGHRFAGPFRGEGEFDQTPLAMVNPGGYDDVTVRNGSIPGWLAGIRFEGAARTRLVDLKISLAATFSYSIRLSDSEDSEIRHVDAAFGGIQLRDSPRAVVADSTAFGNGGISVQSSNTRIVRNTVGPGQIFVTGIGVIGSGNRIANNRVFRYDLGNIVIRNGANNLVVDNEVSESPGNDDSVDVGYGDGVFVGAFTAGTVLRGNVAYGNQKDGIEVHGSATRIGDNRAEGNGDFGIDAVAGVTDLGGNTASGNGNPLQCRNVFCQ